MSPKEGANEYRDCELCGRRFGVTHPQKRYCAKTCQRRASNRRHQERQQQQARAPAAGPGSPFDEIVTVAVVMFGETFSRGDWGIARRWARLASAIAEDEVETFGATAEAWARDQVGRDPDDPPDDDGVGRLA